MANMSPKKTPMPEQEPQQRISNSDEVSLGYTPQMAIEEAKRCINCKNHPCVSQCPVNVSIPEFIECIANEEFEKAYQIITKTNSLPAVCGRVCPQETQCEGKCVRGIKGEPVAIGRLERFVADYHNQNAEDEDTRIGKNGIKVAIVGSGPAGLACAGDLVKMGYDVTIFEAFHVSGGVLMYGIPEFRLPKKIVQKEISRLEKMGVKIENNMVIGKSFSIDDLFEEGYKSVFIGNGAGLPRFQGIPGESLNGVYSANEFLTRINLMKASRDDYDTPIIKAKKVAVIGGGNVAMDAARCAKRLGADEVSIIYRRSENEMPARFEEIHHAKEEGIVFKYLTNPVAINGDENNFVKSIECVSMELGKPDSSGRRSPSTVEGSNHTFDVDTVIVAIGNIPNTLITKSTGLLERNKRGGLSVDEKTMQTSYRGVFAGGDAVTGAATVILAMGAGKKAAKFMDEYIKSNK